MDAQKATGEKRLVAMSELEPVIFEVINSGNKAELTMTGDSMRPFLHDGKDIIVLEAVTPQKPCKKYDVLFYRRKNGCYVLHRLVGFDKNGYVMCGDAQFDVEHGISENMIIARLSGYYSYRDTDKFISCSSPAYRLKAACWVKSRELRRFFFRLKRKLKSLNR